MGRNLCPSLQIEEVLLRNSFTKLKINICTYQTIPSRRRLNAPLEVKPESILKTAVDMYKRIWPTFRRKFPRSSDREASAETKEFCSLTVESYEETVGHHYYGGHHSFEKWEARFTRVEGNRNSFRVKRYQSRDGNARNRLPSVLHTVG
jgi:hypothetical protein